MERLKYIFSFEGRFGRQQYFFTCFGFGIALGLIYLLVSLVFYTGDDMTSRFLFYLFTIISFAGTVSFATRRFHDMDKSGWWSLFILIPLINIIAAIILLFVKGTTGPNQYGPDPLAPKLAVPVPNTPPLPPIPPTPPQN